MPCTTGSWADPFDRSRLRTRRAGAARRQDRVGHLRLLARQTAEKGGDLVDLVSGQLSSELARPHDGDRLPQIPGLTRMKIRRSQGDVAQSGDLEDIFVARGLADHETAFVGRRQKFGSGFFDHPERGAYMPPPMLMPLRQAEQPLSMN